jgi:triosephosphate isomerase
VALGAQNLYPEAQGAFTGEHSAAMLQDAGARYVILGHSERRALLHEDDGFICRKLTVALAAGLRPILCVGEQLAQRRDGATFRVLRNQLDLALSGIRPPTPDPGELAVAYEPVWAIGTGQNATAAQAQEAMAFLRDRLAERFGRGFAERVRLLYGGSASPDNAGELAVLPDVDGFLVGGASLDAGKFARMAEATAQAKGAARITR